MDDNDSDDEYVGTEDDVGKALYLLWHFSSILNNQFY
jgi:hypothetical protein